MSRLRRATLPAKDTMLGKKNMYGCPDEVLIWGARVMDAGGFDLVLAMYAVPVGDGVTAVCWRGWGKKKSQFRKLMTGRHGFLPWLPSQYRQTIEETFPTTSCRASWWRDGMIVSQVRHDPSKRRAAGAKAA